MKVKDPLRREFAKDNPFHGELGVADCLKEQRNFQTLSPTTNFALPLIGLKIILISRPLTGKRIGITLRG